jgi:integrase
MDLAYLTGQRPADVLKIAAPDLNNGFLLIGQGKTEKRLRLRLEDAGIQSGLSAFIDDLQERRAINGIRTSTLITNASGLRMSQQMLRNRWDDAREKAAIKATLDGDPALAISIRQFQFKDIRPKAASEIELTHASRLLGHSTEEMTKKDTGESVRLLSPQNNLPFESLMAVNQQLPTIQLDITNACLDSQAQLYLSWYGRATPKPGIELATRKR